MFLTLEWWPSHAGNPLPRSRHSSVKTAPGLSSTVWSVRRYYNLSLSEGPDSGINAVYETSAMASCTLRWDCRFQSGSKRFLGRTIYHRRHYNS